MGQGLIIPSGSYVTQSAGNIVLTDNWTNNGSFTPSGGTVIFSGISQSISGTSLQTFNNLTITSPAIVTIPAQIDVTVNGILTNNTGNTGLVIQSTAAGTGSLINNTAGVGASVGRYMVANRWHIMATPVAGQSLPGFLTNASNNIPTSGSNYGMMYYSESGGGWVYYTNPASGNASVGSGYLLRNTVDGAVNLAGTLNAAVTDVNLTRIANGWNCIGNPFPCSIGVNSDATTSDNFLTYNALALDPSFAALYLWVEPAVRVSGVSYYGIICNAGFISTTGRAVINQAYMQPGQGFIVKSTTGGGTVSFTPNMRLHENTGSYLKSAKTSWAGINLIVRSTTKTASTAISLHENMTRGLDITYDIGLFGGDPAFQLYSRLLEDKGVNFMLQCLPEDGFENMRVPIGFNCKNGGTVTFSADIVPLPLGVKAILLDSLRGKSVELIDSTTTYSTDIDPNSSGIGRFFLNIFNSSSPSTSINSTNRQLDIYSIGKYIYIKGNVPNNTSANIYNESGQLVQNYKLQQGNLNILRADGLSIGTYIVKVYGGISEAHKVILE